MDLGKYGPETHKKILEFWKNNEIYPKSRIIFEKSNNKKPFYFLQGPPYTSGKFHMGHAWNNSMKDFVMRFKRMNGFEVWDRGGYDMHGLPTARAVQKLHNLKTKKDIENFGFEKFTNECIKLSTGFAKQMNQDLWDMGVWMDHENAYMPITQEYIDGVWFLVKTAHEKKRLYEGLRTTTWCRDCGTALAKHEQEYTELVDKSIYVKFQSKDDENLYYIIWTTTPWTITFNLGIMVHPEFEYCKLEVDVNGKKEFWVLAKELIETVMKKTEFKYKIVDTFVGKTLEGKKYNHFWAKDIKDLGDIDAKYDNAHSILLSKEYVTLDSGTGLVHTAPGCGPEDYEIGHRNGLPPFNTINEQGKFVEGYIEFTGLTAKVDDKKFIENMEKLNVLVTKEDYVHDYAKCERCHTPVVFRTTKQWFFKVEDLKPKMLEFHKKTTWVPKTGGNAFASWLENLRDNSITKQRFWGTPLPVWRCNKCNKIEVIGSRKELETKVKDLPENLHKPWIDTVKWKCECGSDMIRIPDIMDVWIDAGTAVWNCLDYSVDKKNFEKFFPADFILEAREQVRGWFNLLMITSTLAFDKCPLKACYMHGMLTDVDGVKMSKSIGNVIKPTELTDKYGADTLRFYMSRTKAGQDVNFSWLEAELAYKTLMILWNVHKLVINYADEINVKPSLIVDKDLDISSKYIMSRLHSTLKSVTEKFNNYHLDQIPKEIEELFLELSRTYIQLNRDNMALGSDKEKILNVMFTVLYETVKMLTPICPFITEQIYQNFKEKGFVKEESVNLEFWSKFDEKFIDANFEKEFSLALTVVEAGLNARDKAQIGVRWPLMTLLIDTDKKEIVEKFSDIIKTQLNIKNIEFGAPEFDIQVKVNYRSFGSKFGSETGEILTKIKGKEEEIANVFKLDKDYSVDFGKEPVVLGKDLFDITKVCETHIVAESKLGEVYLDKTMNKDLENEGFAREITRRVQSLRKSAEMNKSDRIELFLQLPSELDLTAFEDNLKTKVGAISLTHSDVNSCEFKSNEKIKGKLISIGFNKKSTDIDWKKELK
jgi:isoleucyl-tRNA synthetase